jgi:hypothetical protein
MKRSETVKKLMSEGFSEKTLVNMSDNELKMLSDRILSEQITTVPGKPAYKVGDKGGSLPPSPKGYSVTIDPTDKKPVAQPMESEVKEELKGNQKKLDKNHNGKIDAQDFKILKGKKKESKEKNKEVNEWVDSLVDSQYYSFTSKNEIIEMITSKINEQYPEIAEPDTDTEIMPGIDAPPSEDEDPFIDPWDNPNEGPDPEPKFEKSNGSLPDFMTFKNIINSFN